jgi:hypothetical protein
MLSRQVAVLAPKLPGDGNGAFAFKRAHHGHHCVLGRYLNAHVDMIGHQLPVQSCTFFVAGSRRHEGLKP